MQGTSTTESYSYDPVGNRTASLGVSSYTTNASNEMTANSNASYTYDSNGNTLSKTVGSDTTSYTWDYENRLTSVTLPGSGGTVSFKYDPLGRRIEKVSPTFTSIFAYDGDNLIETANSTGGVVARYTQGQNIDEPLAELRSSTTSYYEADGLGSITSLTSAAGALANTYTYDSYGKLTASSGSVSNPFTYTGREFDSETGLYYYRARYYDQTTGRFLGEDPIRFAAGPNFYAYVGNGAVNNSDPRGLAPSCPPNNCLPRSNLPFELRAQLALMKLASKLTGVTYYTGLQGSYAITNGGFGLSGGVAAGYATDPQGNEGIVYSVNGAATLGTSGGGGGIEVGAATYQNINGFSGNSFGKQASVGLGMSVGGGYNTNSAGVYTHANVGAGAGVNISPSTVSRAPLVILICP
jgi:RHS repeat-associated protein